MKKTFNLFGRAMLFALSFLLVSALVSCKTDDEETSSLLDQVYPLDSSSILLNVKWADSFTSYNSYDNSYDVRISDTFIETSSYGKQEGTVYQRKLSESSGYLYYKISDTSSFSYSYKDASSYKDMWYGLYYKDLTAESVSMCDAYPSFEIADESYKIADYHCFNTLEEAVKGLTLENKYFATVPEYTKVTE